MNRKILLTVLALGAALLFASAAPVMASQPKAPYAFGAISYDTPGTGKMFFSADKIEHLLGGEGVAYDFGHPWGPGVSTATISFMINVDPTSNQYLKGNAVENAVTTYATGTLELHVIIKFDGLGLFTYHGPTVTATLPSTGPITINDGDQFPGLLMTAWAEGHGSFTDGNVKIKETLAGVSIPGVFGLIAGTGTSMIVGNP